jgi:hypothetical protein
MLEDVAAVRSVDSVFKSQLHVLSTEFFHFFVPLCLAHRMVLRSS